VLFAFHPGIEGGHALADLLFGYEAPSAKLPISLPRATGQVPVYYNHKNSGRPAGQAPFLSRYVDLTHRPLYPFGFGLSYGKFQYANLSVSTPIMRGENRFTVDVTNTGSRPGTEVVQLFLCDMVGSLTRPVKQLKRFERIYLEPGEGKTVRFEITPDDLTFWGADNRMVLEPGDYRVWIGPHSNEGLQGNFTFKG
jgi:beta-glucosidase